MEKLTTYNQQYGTTGHMGEGYQGGGGYDSRYEDQLKLQEIQKQQMQTQID